MIRDPFYREILKHLAELDDGDLFERCMTDIFRDDYPRLAPISGGGDAGMDGAIDDGHGEPFPVVITISDRVIGNLTRNLEYYIHKGGERRDAILITSRKLSARRKRNLENRALKLEFTLRNIYDRDAVADRLYQNSRWCKDLLGLVGEPPALSVLPKSPRPIKGDKAIARDEDLRLLGVMDGDRLIVGQPGSGKTFLLHLLAKEGEGLFLIEDDRERVARNIREEKPKAIFVDDAQVQPDRIDMLRHLREQIGAEYSIVATCWPGDQGILMEHLAIPPAKVLELKQLTRSQIVDVLKEFGLVGPRNLIQLIVDQAEGRPGLAVTLAHQCLLDNVRAVVNGEALQQSLSTSLQNRLGRDSTLILGAFGLGGDRGMTLEDMVGPLRMSLSELRGHLVELSHGGIAHVLENQYVSIRPPTFRVLMVRDAFFSDTPPVNPAPFLEYTPSWTETAKTLVNVRALGGDIDPSLLLNVLERSEGFEAWIFFAGLGPHEARKAMARNPEMIKKDPSPFLHHVPEEVLLTLFELADEEEEFTVNWDLIKVWIKSAGIGSFETLRRRRAVLRMMEQWLEQGREERVLLSGLHLVITPIYDAIDSDPGDGNTVTLYRGFFSTGELQEIGQLWPGVLAIIKKMDDLDWQMILKTVLEWVQPSNYNVEITEEQVRSMKEIAGTLLADLANLAGQRYGVIQKLQHMASQLNMTLNVPEDDIFSVLFPEGKRIHEMEDTEPIERPAYTLGVSWAHEPPSIILSRINNLEAEADRIGKNWPRLIPQLCQSIANQADPVLPWAEEAIQQDCKPDVVNIFLMEAVQKNEVGWTDLALSSLGIERYRHMSAAIILTRPSSPEDLLRELLSNMDGLEKVVELVVLRGQVPEEQVRMLLQHDNGAIAAAAALGEWKENPRGIVHESLLPEWKEAVLEIPADEHWIGKICDGDLGLAKDWLLRVIQKEQDFYVSDPIREVLDQLDAEGRQTIFEAIPENAYFPDLVRFLVSKDTTLYSKLLNRPDLQSLHLQPLKLWGDSELMPDALWCQKALLALEHGYNPEEIAEAVRGGFWMTSGGQAGMYAKLIDLFSALLDHQDTHIQQIGDAGLRWARERHDKNVKREHEEKVFGRH